MPRWPFGRRSSRWQIREKAGGWCCGGRAVGPGSGHGLALPARLAQCRQVVADRLADPRMNSVIEFTSRSSALTPQVCTSTPVESNREVVTSNGYFDSGSMKLTSCDELGADVVFAD